MGQTILGPSLPNIPWDERPADCDDVVWRHSANPIIGWNPIPCAARIFNSAVIPFDGAFAGVFRADYRNGRPQLHAGRSDNGLRWDIDPQGIQWVDEQGASAPTSYAYDPRVVQLDHSYYVTWCDDFPGPSIGLGQTRDFKRFVRLERPLMPFNRNGVLFPRKIGGLYVMLSRPSDSGHTAFGDIVLSHSPDLTYWGRHRLMMRSGGDGWWQGVKIGAGPVPIETREGWLLLYHGVSGPCNGFVYSMGAALLDLDDPTRVRYRTRDYLLTPEKPYETVGFVPNVAFPCAALCDAGTGRIAIYYGAADEAMAGADLSLSEILAALEPV